MQTDNFPNWVRKILAVRRNGRYRHMIGGVKTWPSMSVIDIGCGRDGRSFADYADKSWYITGIDLFPPKEVDQSHPRFQYHEMSADNLSSFSEQSFDLAVSVGMLEHIVDPDLYLNTCNEIQRVAKQYLVIVPYKWAWIEPHYGVPFFGAMPKRCQRFLISTFNLSGHGKHLDYFENHFRWRSNSEYRKDFPGSCIRFMPTFETIAITKSL